jgi:hypothetical protein
MIPRVAHRLLSLLGGPTSRSLATTAHLSHTGPEPHTKVSGWPRPLPSPSVACFAAPHDLSSVLTPGRNGGSKLGCIKYASSNKGRHAPLTLLGLRDIPVLPCMDNTPVRIPQWPHPSREPRVRPHQQANAHLQILPPPDLPSWKPGPRGRITPWVASSPSARRGRPGCTWATEYRHAVPSREITWPSGTLPCGVKIGVKAKPPEQD